jgi:hypothetical protein
MAEKVLLVCTSTASNVRKAIGVLKSVLFQSSQIDLLCKSSELPEYEKKSLSELMDISKSSRP